MPLGYTLLQKSFRLKDKSISPSITMRKFFGLKTIGTGVSLQGATSKRDSMWHSPVFTSIRPKSRMYCACIYVISELHSVEGQSNISLHLQYERFGFKNNTHRRVFAWRHLEAGQYVAQSGLHLHQSEPHSCQHIQEIRC